MNADRQSGLEQLKQSIRASAVGTIEAPEPGWIARRYRLGADFIGFSGHFPGYPILPAVLQIAMAVTLIEEYSGEIMRLTSLDNAKFLIQIRPDQEIEVRCRRRIIGDTPCWEAGLRAGGKLAATFFLGLVPGGAPC